MTRPFSSSPSPHALYQRGYRARERGEPRTGIEEHPGRLQRFTVWGHWQTIYFTDDKAEAEAALQAFLGGQP